MWKTLGALSIGYSPRPGIMDDFVEQRPGLRVVHAGAMDRIDPREVPSLRYVEPIPGGVLRPGDRPVDPSRRGGDEPDDYRLITHFNPAQVVSIERRDLLPLLQRQIDLLNGTDADAILLLCTGLFPGLSSAKPLLIPHLVFARAMSWLRPKGKTAIVCPLEGQKRAAEEKWRAEGYDPVVLVASPYSGRDMEATGQRLREIRPGAVILDCFGFGETSRQGLGAYVDCPVLSIRLVVRDMLMECFG